MQVLITGSAGKLGHLLRAAWDGGVPGLDMIWSSRQADRPADVTWDICAGPIPKIAKGAVILHLAGVLRGDHNGLAVNALMAVAVCEAARAAGAAHVFLASSAAVYGANSAENNELRSPTPLSDYGRAKLDMEKAVHCWRRRAGPKPLGITCLRIGNVVGADALFGVASRTSDLVLDPVPEQPKGPIRSYIGPQALAQVLADLIHHVRGGRSLPSILNIASPRAVSMVDLLDAANMPFQLGAPNAQVIPMVRLSTKRLSAFAPVYHANASEMIADWRGLMVTAV